MTYETIELDVEENTGIATLWLNRPDAHNTVNRQFAKEVRSMGYELAQRRDLRALVLRGRGKCFSAGGDMAMFRDHMDELGTYMLDVIPDFHEFLLSLRQLPVPTIAAVHGAVAGGGLSMALACDFVVAEAGTRFAIAYRRLGASSDGGMSYLLTHLVGPRKAMDLLLRSDSFDAAEALSLGLITAQYSKDAFEAKLTAMVTTLALNAPSVVREVKGLVYSAATNTYATHLHAEAASFSRCAATSDFHEGVTAFLEKRSPLFTGS